MGDATRTLDYDCCLSTSRQSIMQLTERAELKCETLRERETGRDSDPVKYFNRPFESMQPLDVAETCRAVIGNISR